MGRTYSSCASTKVGVLGDVCLRRLSWLQDGAPGPQQSYLSQQTSRYNWVSFGASLISAMCYHILPSLADVSSRRQLSLAEPNKTRMMSSCRQRSHVLEFVLGFFFNRRPVSRTAVKSDFLTGMCVVFQPQYYNSRFLAPVFHHNANFNISATEEARVADIGCQTRTSSKRCREPGDCGR